MKPEIVVPEAMLNAVSEKWFSSINPRRVLPILMDALTWLAENPVEPTEKEFESVYLNHTFDPKNVGMYGYGRYIAMEWQRRMFLKREPEYPARFQSMLNTYPEHLKVDLIAAYKLGKESK